MTTEKIATAIAGFKADTLNHNKLSLQQEGELPPVVSIFLLRPDDTFHYIGFSMEELGIHKGLEFVAKFSLPIIIKGLTSQNIKPLCLSFSTEAFISKIRVKELFNHIVDAKSEEEFRERLRKVEQQEVLMTIFETASDQETPVFNMIRIGKTVNSKGRLVDRIELEPGDMPKDAKMRGLFGNLLKDAI